MDDNTQAGVTQQGSTSPQTTDDNISTSENAESNSTPTETSKPESKAQQTFDSEKGEPIQDWSKIDLQLGENSPVDKALLNSFGQAAVAAGLTATQAKALVDWQIDAVAHQREALVDAGAKELSREWGNKATQYQKEILTLISNIDRQIGGDNAFSKALEACGATCFPAVMKGLLCVANAISEDSFGSSRGSGMRTKPESALEGIQDAFRQARENR